MKDGVDGGEKVRHALDIAEGSVVFVVCQEHVFHLLHVHVCADFGEGGVRIGVGDVFAGEYRDAAVGAVDVFFCVDSEG